MAHKLVDPQTFRTPPRASSAPAFRRSQGNHQLGDVAEEENHSRPRRHHPRRLSQRESLPAAVLERRRATFERGPESGPEAMEGSDPVEAELVRGLGFSPALVWFGTRKGLGTHGASGDRTDLVRLATTKDGGLLCWKHRCWSDFAV